MASGFPASSTVEIEFTSGTWTDVTTYVDWNQGVEIKQGRASEFDDVSPGEITFTLYNLPDTTTGISPFTPDSPISPYYPNITKGKRVRFKVTKSATTYQRFIGWIQAWSVSLPDSVAEATVSVTAVDRLGIQNTRPMNALWAENWKTVSTNVGASWDVWPFDEQTNASSFRNLNPSGQPAQIIYPSSRGGKLDVSSSPNGLFADGVIGVQKDTTASRSAPYVWVKPSGWDTSTHRQFMFSFRSTEKSNDQIVAALYATSTPRTYTTAQIVLAANGQLQWWVSGSLSPARPGVDVDMAVGGYSPSDSGLRYNDGKWHTIFMLDDTDTAQWVCFIDGGYQTPGTTGATVFLIVGSDPYTGSGDATTRTRAISLGGAEKNAYGFNGDIGMVATNTDNAYVSTQGGYEKWGVPGTNLVQDTIQRVLRADLGATASAGTDYTLTGSNDRLISMGPTGGSNVGDIMSTLARTVGGTYWINPTTGLPTFILSDANRPTSVTATVDLSADDDISQGQQWTQNVVGKPTRVEITSPMTTLVAIDSTAETLGIPTNQQSVDTWSADVTSASDAAWARLRIASSLRLSQLSVDLVTAQNDLYAAFLGSSLPGMRIRVTSIPTGFIGVSQVDAYVQGWTEKYSSTGVVWSFDTTPADAPGEAVFDTSRFSWGDGVCTVSACTASATSLTLTWTGTAALSTTAGDYPLDLNVNGERVTVTTAPSGSTSPQTVTVTRGVSPTVARAHVAGETVDVWNGYTYAF